jgi:hypothetical protein
MDQAMHLSPRKPPSKASTKKKDDAAEKLKTDVEEDEEEVDARPLKKRTKAQALDAYRERKLMPTLRAYAMKIG